MKIKNVAILTLDGYPMREQRDPRMPPDPNAPIVTVAKVLGSVAVAPPMGGQPHDEKSNVDRLMAGIACQQAALGQEFELDSAMAVALKADVQKAYAPVVAGQVALIIEGKEVPIKPAPVDEGEAEKEAA